MSEYTEFKVNQWLADFKVSWAALHHSDPVVNGAYASEISGNGYSRAKVSFSDPDSRSTWNITEVLWPSLPTVRVTHLSLWNAQYDGDMLAVIDFRTPIQLISGNALRFGPQELALSL